MEKSDVLIIGSGIAALQLAHNLSRQLHVRIITKSVKKQSNSYLAQGGVAAAMDPNDDYRLHFQDTIDAGENFQNELKVLHLVKEAPNIINDLMNSGVEFDKNKYGELSLGKEGAHSRKRIVHCGGDATGKHIMEHFFKTIPNNISFVENEFVYELLIQPQSNKCVGVKTKSSSGKINVYVASHTVLAVGGVGGLYSYTSNAPTVTGDGAALALRAGAELTDMEFIQFHPTLLSVEGKTAGLISEAVRGAGGFLVNDLEELIMQGRHPLGDLAPRHVVAQEIFQQRLQGREVFLNIQLIDHFEEKFPTITELCQLNRIDLVKGKIPVTPGCHFTMGGIVIDEVGKTSINQLYAIGEVAWCGVHGANRLASNSLLEGLYFGRKLANYINSQKVMEPPIIECIVQPTLSDKALHLPTILEIQERMMKDAGIVRNERQLVNLQNWLDSFDIKNLMLMKLDHLSISEIQIIFMLIAADLITRGALLRTESRGGHIREDFPTSDSSWGRRHIVQTNKHIELRDYSNECNQTKVHA